MIQATTRTLMLVLWGALLAGVAGGCSVSADKADKAGSSAAPVVLRLAVADDADQPDAPYARYFARRVAALSDGSCDRSGTPPVRTHRATSSASLAW